VCGEVLFIHTDRPCVGGGGWKPNYNHTKFITSQLITSTKKFYENVLKDISLDYLLWETKRKNAREKTKAH
jgi:hypothetical protein